MTQTALSLPGGWMLSIRNQLIAVVKLLLLVLSTLSMIEASSTPSNSSNSSSDAALSRQRKLVKSVRAAKTEVATLILMYIAIVISGLNTIVAFKLLRRRQNGNNLLYRLLFIACLLWTIGLVFIMLTQSAILGEFAPEILMLIGNLFVGAGLYLYVLMIIFRFQIVRQLRSYNKVFDQTLLVFSAICAAVTIISEVPYRIYGSGLVASANQNTFQVLEQFRNIGQIIGFISFVIVDNLLDIILIVIIYNTRRRCNTNAADLYHHQASSSSKLSRSRLTFNPNPITATTTTDSQHCPPGSTTNSMIAPHSLSGTIGPSSVTSPSGGSSPSPSHHNLFGGGGSGLGGNGWKTTQSPATTMSSLFTEREVSIRRKTIIFIVFFLAITWLGVVVRILANMYIVTFPGMHVVDSAQLLATIHLLLLTLTFTLAFKYISQLQLLTHLKHDSDYHTSTFGSTMDQKA